MSIEITKVATVELIRELERRLKCTEAKSEKYHSNANNIAIFEFIGFMLLQYIM